MQPEPLTLASASPRRRQLLEMLGVPVRVVPSNVAEVHVPGEAPRAYVERLARDKATSVPGDLVLGADTTVVLDGQLLEKPADADDAVRMLRLLQGRTHEVMTSVALVSGGVVRQATDVTRVTFRPADEEFLRAYVATGEPMDKAGAYGIQGYGAALIDRIEGDFFGVMGLPLRLVLELLAAVGRPYAFPGGHNGRTGAALHRVAAFTTDPSGGNPAGVWIGDELPGADEMQRVAAEVGFSETVFIAPAIGADRTARYYSPLAEVTFCGHATIAAGVVLGEAEGDGTYHLSTLVGDVPVAVRTRDGRRTASLTSVEPRHVRADPELVDGVLAALGWRRDDLDPSIPPARAYAGAWHLVLAAGSAERLARLDYDFEALKSLMLAADLTTVQLVWRERPDLFHSRNPFPVGGVVEDPATGAAAAALGGYLRDAGLVRAPATLVIRQGVAMGRPGELVVDVPERGGIVVTGSAVRMEQS